MNFHAYQFCSRLAFLKNIKYVIALLVLAFSIGCKKSKSDSASDSGTGATPTAGFDMIITDITGTSASISWGSGLDTETASADLQYKLYYSTSNNMATVTDAEANGTAAFDWTANKLDAMLTLTHSTTYYFAVLVKDAAGNKVIYAPATATTKCSGKVIYLHALSAGGNLGGITGADQKCSDNKPIGSTSVFKAMIVLGSTRRACTTEYCSGGVSENQDWVLAANTSYCTSDFESKVFETNSAGIINGSPSALASVETRAFTGLGDNWIGFGPNCTSWTSNSAGQQGRTGNAQSVDTSFFSLGSITCDNNASLYCVEQ